MILERALFAVGAGCLVFYVATCANGSFFQFREKAAFERALAAAIHAEDHDRSDWSESRRRNYERSGVRKPQTQKRAQEKHAQTSRREIPVRFRPGPEDNHGHQGLDAELLYDPGVRDQFGVAGSDGCDADTRPGIHILSSEEKQGGHARNSSERAWQPHNEFTPTYRMSHAPQQGILKWREPAHRVRRGRPGCVNTCSLVV